MIKSFSRTNVKAICKKIRFFDKKLPVHKTRSKWGLLILLSIIWGSSFILIKKSLLALTPTQIGALRTLIAGLPLLLLGFKHFKTYRKRDYLWLAAAGLFENFLPVFLFAFAQTEVPSGVTGVLNALVPSFTLLTGLAFFGEKRNLLQVVGILIGLLGSWYLIHPGDLRNQPISLFHTGLIILATLFYGLGANIAKRKLGHLKPLGIATGSLSFFIIPALVVLSFTDFQHLGPNATTWQSLVSIILLSTVGTALAYLGFYKLIQMSSAVFATSLTYLIPLVSILWAVLDGETFKLFQLVGTLLILVGIYLINEKKRKKIR